MRFIARLVVQRRNAWMIVAIVACVAILASWQAAGLRQEDDLLAFLPRENPEVMFFRDVTQRFGGTDVALVGLSAPDVFVGDFQGRLRRATDRLEDLPGLHHVMSLSNTVDFSADPSRGGVITAPLVGEIPQTDAESRALAARVMAREHLVGTLVSKAGDAVLIYGYLAHGANPRHVAVQVSEIVTEAFPKTPAYWGGAPFVSTYVYNTTQRDLMRLTPWAVLAIVLIMMLVFRDLVGTSVALLSTAIGIVISLGLMAAFDVGFNIVLGSTPVVLFAIGSAYGVHILACYYRLTEDRDCEQALVDTITQTGPIVIAAGLTTVVSLLSFVLMDIQPLRVFGLFTAVGILATLVLSVTFVPAVVRIFNLRKPPSAALGSNGLVTRWTTQTARFARRHRALVGACLAAAALVSAFWVSRVDTTVDLTAFFSSGSPPDRASRFMREKFGGSTFVQVHVRGDMADPHVLREIRRVADRVSLIDHVTGVSHIGDAVARSNDALVGYARIPDTAEQVGLLYSFFGTEAAVSQLVTTDRRQALMHVRLDVDDGASVERVLAEIEDVLRGFASTNLAVAEPDSKRARESLTDLIWWRVSGLMVRHGAAPIDRRKLSHLLTSTNTVDAQSIAPAVERFLRSEECAVQPSELGSDDPIDRLALAFAALGPSAREPDLARSAARVLQRPEQDELILDLAYSAAAPIEEIWREARADALASLLTEELLTSADEDLRSRLHRPLTIALMDLDVPTVGVSSRSASALTLGFQATGLPVMHRGLSKSVARNQIVSVAFALALVLVIMTILFRSLFSGMMAMTPTLLTLLVVYGGMGMTGVHLDIGTSMLASLIMGAGVDYAVHLVSAWRTSPGEPVGAGAERAARRTGPAIWTTAIMICAGFSVLTLGEARPLQNVGGLTAAAMLVAAVATFLGIPVLARRREYLEQGEPVTMAVDGSSKTATEKSP